jgi:hypothetical protein
MEKTPNSNAPTLRLVNGPAARAVIKSGTISTSTRRMYAVSGFCLSTILKIDSAVPVSSRSSMLN